MLEELVRADRLSASLVVPPIRASVGRDSQVSTKSPTQTVRAISPVGSNFFALCRHCRCDAGDRGS
jgi:hypothetical protein